MDTEPTQSLGMILWSKKKALDLGDQRPYHFFAKRLVLQCPSMGKKSSKIFRLEHLRAYLKKLSLFELPLDREVPRGGMADLL